MLIAKQCSGAAVHTILRVLAIFISRKQKSRKLDILLLSKLIISKYFHKYKRIGGSGKQQTGLSGKEERSQAGRQFLLTS